VGGVPNVWEASVAFETTGIIHPKIPSHPRRPESSATPLRQSQDSHLIIYVWLSDLNYLFVCCGCPSAEEILNGVRSCCALFCRC
jgi:hypothetical protein